MTDSRAIQWAVWGGLFIIIATIVALFFLRQDEGSNQPLPVYGQVSDFLLTNQFGNAITLSNLQGKLCLADVIFTRCPGPCAEMTRQMDCFQKQAGAIPL